MSDASSEQIEETVISAKDVIAFLRDNPQFIKEHPESLELLIPPKERPRRGQVADFQAYAIERLKDEKEKVVGTAREIIENSRANMNNQKRIHDAVLRLLEANTFDDFIHTITMDLANLMDTDITVFLVESEGTDIPHINTSGIRVIPQGTVDKWMVGKNVLLQDNISGIEPIYGGGATLVRSQILLRIGISQNTPPAILAFGSRDPDMFAEGQATDQILFLARVLERAFRMWLELPQQ